MKKIRLYGQSLLANSTNKLFFKCDGKDLKDIVNIFNLTEQEEKMILNAKSRRVFIYVWYKKIIYDF